MSQAMSELARLRTIIDAAFERRIEIGWQLAAAEARALLEGRLDEAAELLGLRSTHGVRGAPWR